MKLRVKQNAFIFTHITTSLFVYLQRRRNVATGTVDSGLSQTSDLSEKACYRGLKNKIKTLRFKKPHFKKGPNLNPESVRGFNFFVEGCLIYI